MKKNKFLIALSGIVSALFLTYIITLARGIGRGEQSLLESPNIVDVTDKIQTKLMVTSQNFSEDLSWTQNDISEAGWDSVSIPKHRIVQQPEFKEGNFAYYRIHIPKKELESLSAFPNEIFLGLQYIHFSKLDIFVNGVLYASNSPTNYGETIINIPIRDNRDNLVAIKGYIKTGDSGINHRGKILIGKGAELNELYRKAYKASTVLPLIYILCKGSIFFIFTLIFMVMKVESFVEKFLMYGCLVLSEDVLTGDFLNHVLNLNTQVYLYNVVNIGIVTFLFLFLSDVLDKKYLRRTLAKFVGGMAILSYLIAFDLLHTNYIFEINHLLKAWNISLLLVLAYFVPKVFKIDKVLFGIVAISLALIAWSTFFSVNVGLNLKAMANLLLFFMVAYQTFVLFRREQNLLQTKQKELLEQEKDVAIGKTAALLAHDVRRPLEQMSLILNRIAAGDSSESFLRAAKRDVDFSITSVGNQINDIMNFSRSKEISLETISFYKILSGAIKQVVTINKNITLQIVYDFKATDKILGDESRLSSVLTNLISNSVEAIRDIGGQSAGTLKFSTAYRDGLFEFKVFNDGPQIPFDIIQDIFKPLVTHGKNRGTGLGLASVLKIMKEHQGDIMVVNVEPVGVEFTLNLQSARIKDQLILEDFESNSKAYTYEKVESNNNSQMRCLRIFLFDDDSQVYEYFQFITKNLDFDVELVFASDLGAAKNIVRSKRFDLYILDYDLGGGSTGLDFYKENLGFLTSEVILHTNRDQAVLNREKCLYQSKPISIESLAQICEDTYSKRLKILLADDSKLTLIAWEMFHGKHNIITVDSPEKALEALESGAHQFAMCVVDYYFDNSIMNGTDLAVRIRQLKPEMKIVMASFSENKVENTISIQKNAFEVRGL